MKNYRYLVQYSLHGKTSTAFFENFENARVLYDKVYGEVVGLKIVDLGRGIQYIDYRWQDPIDHTSSTIMTLIV